MSRNYAGQMGVPRRVQRYLDRAGQRVVGEAGKLWNRHHGPFERLADLTPIAASGSEPTYLFSTQDRVISPEVFAHSGYEEDELRWVLEYLGQPQEGRTVVEVGANIGTTTVPLLVRYRAARVEAFEPDPFNYDLLRCNLILNHVDTQAVTHPLAISDANGEVIFEQCQWNFGDHRVRIADEAIAKLNGDGLNGDGLNGGGLPGEGSNGEGSNGEGLHGEASRSTITVPARRLDDAVTTPLEEIGLVWVDAQGHEAHILDGAQRLLGQGFPWAIEYWPYGLSRQGGLARLNRAMAQRFTNVVDVRQSRRQDRVVRVETTGLDRLAGELGDNYTDLLLVPEAAIVQSS